jgi:hypothetical protein
MLKSKDPDSSASVDTEADEAFKSGSFLNRSPSMNIRPLFGSFSAKSRVSPLRDGDIYAPSRNEKLSAKQSESKKLVICGPVGKRQQKSCKVGVIRCDAYALVRFLTVRRFRSPCC